MIPNRRSILKLACLLAGVVLALPAAATAAARTLPDSTSLDRWMLPNGLRVVARNVPRANAVAVTICYRGGSGQDPPGREGLAALLAEVQYTAPAGDVPARSRLEISGLRPMGWNLRVTRDLVLLSESASLPQFPGVIHQVAIRMRGVTVTSAALKSAQATVQSDLARRYAADPDLALGTQVRELAAQHDPERIEHYASGKGLQGLSTKQVQRLIGERFVPAGAVLSVAGNLAGIDVRRLIEGEFGGIPGGTRAPVPAPERLAPTRNRYVRPGISRPLTAVGLLAPALTDSLHPIFYLRALQLGSYSRQAWSPVAPPLTTTFEYSMLDEPDLAIYYPPSSADVDGTGQFRETVRQLMASEVDEESRERLFQAIQWLLGGPLPPEMLQRVRTDPAALHALSSSSAAREMRGDSAFWEGYRERFRSGTDPGEMYWGGYFLSATHQVWLDWTPK